MKATLLVILLFVRTVVSFRPSSSALPITSRRRLAAAPTTTSTHASTQLPHSGVRFLARNYISTPQPLSPRRRVSSKKTIKLFSRQQLVVHHMTTLDASVPPPDSVLVKKLRRYAITFCNLFPVWTLLTALVALRRPATFLRIPASTFPAQIGLLMLCMGITLRPSDFKRVAQRPGAVALAFVGCYGVVRACACSAEYICVRAFFQFGELRFRFSLFISRYVLRMPHTMYTTVTHHRCLRWHGPLAKLWHCHHHWQLAWCWYPASTGRRRAIFAPTLVKATWLCRYS